MLTVIIRTSRPLFHIGNLSRVYVHLNRLGAPLLQDVAPGDTLRAGSAREEEAADKEASGGTLATVGQQRRCGGRYAARVPRRAAGLAGAAALGHRARGERVED